jgi:hypothetical protein
MLIDKPKHVQFQAWLGILRFIIVILLPQTTDFPSIEMSA